MHIAVGGLDAADDLGLVGLTTEDEVLGSVDSHTDTDLLGITVLVHVQGVVRAAVSGGQLGVGGHVVLQDVSGGLGASRKLLEGSISGGEDHEGAGTVQDGVKAVGLQGSQKNGVIRGASNGLTNGLTRLNRKKDR